MLALKLLSLISKKMKLFNKAFSLLQNDKFDRRRILAAHELYKRAKGIEREEIGSLIESQYALADDPEDLTWLGSLD